MASVELRTLGQVAKDIGVPFYSIGYALAAGHVEDVPQIAGRRVFNAADVKRLEAHFAAKRKAKAERQKARGKSK